MSVSTEYRCDGPGCQATRFGWSWGTWNGPPWIVLETPGRYTAAERARAAVIFADPARRHFHDADCLHRWLHDAQTRT